MKRRRAFWGLVLLAVLGCGLALAQAIPIWQTRRPEVPLDNLIIHELNPLHLEPECESGENRIVKWIPRHQGEVDSSPGNGNSRLDISWRAEHTDEVFAYLLLTQYSNPIVANWGFNGNERRWMYSYPNFVGEVDAAQLYPTEWDQDGFLADEQYAVCGAGDPSCCWLWFFNARYGQYSLFFKYESLTSSARGSMGMDAATFEKMVKEIDKHIHATLLN